MAVASYLLGIDLGTTTCRCALFDLQGSEISSAYCEMPIDYPRPLWAEIDPELWWQGTIQVVRETLAKSSIPPAQISGVGLSGLMHAPVLLDGDMRPVTPAVLWMDQRCAPQCEVMSQEQAALRPGKRTTAPFSTTQTAPKLRWLADMQPHIFAQVRQFMLPKDFVRYRLTGTACTDPSDASGTALFDRKREAWDWQKVQLAHTPSEIMPSIRQSWLPSGQVTAEAAQETGLTPGTIVAVGGSDTLCTRMGVGQLAEREVCIYLGTAAWLALIDGVGSDGRPMMRGFGATATTGAALRWVRDLFEGQAGADVSASYDALTRQAEAVSPGAEGLFFLPHLMGERGPQADPLARGALVGLTLRHSRPQIVRAILEGTAFHLRRLLEARVGSHWPDQGPVGGAGCGGVARSPFWMQLLADVTQLTLRVPAVIEAAVLGAAMLGGMAAGVLSPDEAAAQMTRTGRTYIPNTRLMSHYDASYTRYCQLDDLLAPWFREAGPPE